MAQHGRGLDRQLVERLVRRILMVAFHYPPIRGSSGVQRTLSFSRDLLSFGWRPSVLTVSRGAFELVSEDQLADIPEEVEVHRAATVDARRHLSLWGRTPGPLVLPDRWASWYWTGSWLGRRILNDGPFDAIWSTYPIATAHRIGGRLAADTGIPWIADFRDMMVDEWFPSDPARRRWHQEIESATVQQCARVVVTTDGTRELYTRRYAAREESEVVCIPNGYDEQILGRIGRESAHRSAPRDRLRILHSGILYPEERDPSALFEALASLRNSGRISAAGLEIVFRGSRHDEDYIPMIDRLGIGDIVSLEPGIGYREAIREMFDADGLLLIQAASCNNQIPAKVYEYMRVSRPLLALTDDRGDTARLLRSTAYGTVVPIDDAARIEAGLLDFVGRIRAGNAPLPEAAVVRQYARESASRKLAALLEQVVVPAKT